MLYTAYMIEINFSSLVLQPNSSNLNAAGLYLVIYTYFTASSISFSAIKIYIHLSANSI